MASFQFSSEQRHTSLLSLDCLAPSLRISYLEVLTKLEKWNYRFPHRIRDSLFNELCFFYLHNTKEYLTHRNSWHIFRLILSMHLMKKRLSHKSTFYSNNRHLEIRWIYSSLTFPFISKPVLGCLVGCNLLDRYEIFDKENILLTLQKYIPHVSYVKESLYQYPSKDENIKIIYLEIEKKDETSISLQERFLLKTGLEKRMKNSIQRLSPMVFMGSNKEEIYKILITLNREIQAVNDLPQVHISLDRHTDKEIIFRIHLVQIAAAYPISWSNLFLDCSFISEHMSITKKIKNHPVQAHIFRLHFQREPKLLRSDGSLIFYAARQKVVATLTKALGEFRDFNGSIFHEQQELFQEFKKAFPALAETELEMMETFFYSLVPEEKQIFLRRKSLFVLFKRFLQKREEILSPEVSYSFSMYGENGNPIEDLTLLNTESIFIVVHGISAPAFKETILHTLQKEIFEKKNLIYNLLETAEGFFFNCIIFSKAVRIVEALQEDLLKFHEKTQDCQILKVALDYPIISLDPRIGGEGPSSNILTFLFEGLMRLDVNGCVENGVAEQVEISSDFKEYTFRLRRHQWNDGSLVSAYDFEYAWKKVLCPDFQTAFAYFFYPIQNAREAKEGKCSLDDVGIKVINEQTLKVSLIRPTPYFLQFTAHPIYSPVHRHIDRQQPQWPLCLQKNYPCNGPFQLKINDPSQGYYLIRNPFYKNRPGVFWDKVVMTCMNGRQAFQSFQKKEVDWIGNPFGTWYSYYVAGEDDQIFSFPNSWILWFVFNTQTFPFRNFALRQAFAFAIQRDHIVSDAFLSLTPAYSPLPFSNVNPAHTFFPEYNKKKAQQLFTQALKELGINRRTFPVIELIFHEEGIREYTAVRLQQQLEECFGITCALKPLSFDYTFDKVTKGDFTISLVHWYSWIDDPIYTLNAFKFPKEKINLAKWGHEEFQYLLDCSDQAPNPFERFFYLLQAEKILCREVPIIPIFYQPIQMMTKKNLQMSHNVHQKCRNPLMGLKKHKKKETL